MHVMTKYLDTKKAAIAALQDFHLMEATAEDATRLADQLKDDLSQPASPAIDGMPRQPNPHASENRIIATLDKIDLLAERRRQAREYLEWFLPAWGLLREEDRIVLEGFFLGEGNQDERVTILADRFYIERDSVYRRKNRALDRLADALYGRH